MAINSTTIRLSITRGQLLIAHTRAWLAQHDPLTVLAVPILLFVAVGALLRILLLQSAPPTTATPTPALVIVYATAPAALPPTAAPAAHLAAVVPNTLRRAVVAYDAPAGNVIGAIEQGRAYQVLARFGVDWLQADVTGSGVVWLRADQVLDLPADLVDLKPAPAIVYQPVYVNQGAQAAPQAPAVAPPDQMAYQVTKSEPQATQAEMAATPIPTIEQTLVPMEQTDVTRAWAAEQWRAEHQIGNQTIP